MFCQPDEDGICRRFSETQHDETWLPLENFVPTAPFKGNEWRVGENKIVKDPVKVAENQAARESHQTKIQALRLKIAQWQDFDIDNATNAQLKTYLIQERALLIKIFKALKDLIENAET